MNVVLAGEAHLDQIKRLADSNRKSLGFVTTQAFLLGIQKQWLLVALQEEKLVGFVHYRHRRDRQTTVYEICVDKDLRQQGIGQRLLEALLDEAKRAGQDRIFLKCPFDLGANAFYEAVGFEQGEREMGRKRALQVWKKQL